MATFNERRRAQFSKVSKSFWDCYQKEDETVDQYFRRLMRLSKKMRRLYMNVGFSMQDKEEFRIVLQFTSGSKVNKEVYEPVNEWFINNFIPQKTPDLTIKNALRMARKLEKKHLNANPDETD